MLLRAFTTSDEVVVSGALLDVLEVWQPANKETLKAERTSNVLSFLMFLKPLSLKN